MPAVSTRQGEGYEFPSGPIDLTVCGLKHLICRVDKAHDQLVKRSVPFHKHIEADRVQRLSCRNFSLSLENKELPAWVELVIDANSFGRSDGSIRHSERRSRDLPLDFGVSVLNEPVTGRVQLDSPLCGEPVQSEWNDSLRDKVGILPLRCEAHSQALFGAKLTFLEYGIDAAHCGRWRRTMPLDLVARHDKRFNIVRMLSWIMEDEPCSVVGNDWVQFNWFYSIALDVLGKASTF